MAIYNTSASLENKTFFDGTGNKSPIDAGDAINISFYAKRLTNSGWTTNEVNVFLSENGNDANWTCISGYRASQTNGAYNYFSVGKDAYQKYVYTAIAPSENGDLVYGGGSSVSTWHTCSVQITSSVYFNTKNYAQGNYTHNRRQVFDSFSVTANKPLVEASNTGVLIYQTGDNYIRMGADGLEVKGGDINANTVDSAQISATTFQVRDTIRNESTSSDLVIETQESTTAGTGNVQIQAGSALAAGQTGGNVVLLAGSGSGTGGDIGNGHGIIRVGPSFSPRMIISGSLTPTLGENDVELRFKDPAGDKGVLFFTKQAGMAPAGDDNHGLFKLTCPNSNGRLSLGAGSWNNNLIIDENGRVQIGTALNASLTANTTYELRVTGQLYADATSTISSDSRWKTNVRNINSGSLGLINQLQPVRYNRIMTRFVTGSSPYHETAQQQAYHTSMSEDNTLITSSTDELGFLAQDVLPHIPEVVMYDETEDKYGIMYGDITAHLVGAVKELKAEIDALKNVSHSHS